MMNPESEPESGVPRTPAASNAGDTLEAAELSSLIDAHLSGTLNAEQAARLRGLLTGRPDRQEQLLLAGQVHGALYRLFAEPPGPALLSVHSTSRTGGLRRALTWSATIAACAAALGLLIWLANAPESGTIAPTTSPNVTTPPTFAAWVGDAEALWADESLRPAPGARLGPTTLDLRAGIGKLRLDDGTVLHLEAPVKLELLAANRVFLHSGRLAARMPKGRAGFVVETAKVNVLDQGTEFGVGVEPDGKTFVQVYEGVVAATWKATPRAPLRLVAGEAAEAEPDLPPQATAFAPQRFVRELPIQQSIPAERPRVHTIRSFAATSPPKIDGDLADWDWRGGFRAAAGGEFAERYFIRGAVRHDAQFLYVAAEVGDPAGLRNVIDPEFEPESAWRGGALQLRLSSDASLGWPVAQESEIFQRTFRRNPLPQPSSDRLMSLLLWQYQPTGKPCLYIDYGLGKARSGLKCATDFVAAYQPTDAGYMLEYAIPWKLLRADGPPAEGEALAMCWQLHWSIDGRAHRGYLLEVCNPNEVEVLMSGRPNAWIWHRAAPWGRLWFGDQPPPEPPVMPPPPEAPPGPTPRNPAKRAISN